MYKNIMKNLCSNDDINDDMIVLFRDQKVKLKYAIDICEPGETIEGIHPFQYDKLLKIFEEKRNKKFQYSVDTKYGDWRFILFDIKLSQSYKKSFINPKYDNIKLPEYVKPIDL